MLVLALAMPPALGAERLSSSLLFRQAPERDTSGRSDKMARAMDRHARHKPMAWQADLHVVTGLAMPEKLRVAQDLVNRRITYRDDPENIWLSPQEAYRDGGDCEDYALAKLLLLREAGFPESELRIVTLAPDDRHAVYHVILVARWQGQMFVLDSPGRTPQGGMVRLDGYKDAGRNVVWSAWSAGAVNLPGGGAGQPVAEGRFVPYGPLRMPSYRDYPAREKLPRIAANLLVIRPWEPKLTPEEIERLRLLREYFATPTPENAGRLTPYERAKMDELMAMRRRGY
ncbi:MAG: transglutaminase-like cysteine peptidase [Magnetococcales bacterium]|nr:transglutaminase-like cysteine peptidase [Magnetococcales bacterium]